MKMAKRQIKKKEIPDFQNEDEELTFWDTHDIKDFIEGPAEDVVLALKPRRKRPVTLQLEEELIERLKEIAARHHIAYQALAREVLWRGVRALQ